MKKDASLQILVEADEIQAFIRKQWKTKEFQDSHDNGGFVATVVDKYASLPRFFFEASNPELEAAHFSTWWSGIQKRTYDNPCIHDLYLLHEMHHAAYMPYVSNIGFDNFCRKMSDSENGASLASEIQIYFEIPGLRAKSFPYEIYVDRFLNDPVIQARWKQNPQNLMEELNLRRRNILETQNPADKTEYWIQKFTHQNEAWDHIWSHRYDLVESAMVALRERSQAGDRAGAIKDHIDWLFSDKIAKGGDIPFPGEAKAMAGIYWLNKGIYQEEHDNKAVPVAAIPAPALKIP